VSAKEAGAFNIDGVLLLIWFIVNSVLILSYICGFQMEDLIIPCILDIQKKP